MKITKDKVKQEERILASNRDMEIFFEAITHPTKPNSALVAAAQEYKNQYRSTI
jgi:uncharacterized protein (DUF1778 family)